MTIQEFRDMALSFPGTEENSHFDRAAFKVVKKRIFATLHEQSGTVNLKLTLQDQKVFCDFDKSIVYPIDNKWGLQGWTTFKVKNMPTELMLDALDSAYRDVVRTRKA
jgi:predicted DNA-binding protein (MmcQ/YjbR family)